MAEIVLDGVSKRFDDGYEAVKDMNLEVEDGEFVILVGPSGCGKSTALRMIAGLEDITEGELRIGGDVVNQYAPKDRDIAMVFQNYALYPHMTRAREHGLPAEAREGPATPRSTRRSSEAAKILDLEQHLDRKPANLSGGQRQRVAMGRAIVRDPKAFLMDEPLSNLDAKLRVQMRTEVSRLQKDARDDDRLRHPRPDRGDDARRPGRGDARRRAAAGRRRRASSTSSPTNLFVAGFIGSPAMNFMPATLEGDTVKLPFGDVRAARRAPRPARRGARARRDRRHPAGVVRGRLAGRRPARPRPLLKAKIDLVESMGSELYVYFEIESEGVESQELEELAADSGAAEVPGAGTGQVVARLAPESQVERGEETELWLDTSKLHLFDPQSGERLGA